MFTRLKKYWLRVSKKWKAIFEKPEKTIAVHGAQSDQNKKTESSAIKGQRREPLEGNELESAAQASLDIPFVPIEPLEAVGNEAVSHANVDVLSTHIESIEGKENEASSQTSVNTSSSDFNPSIKEYTNDSNGPWSSVALRKSHSPMIAARAASMREASSSDRWPTLSESSNRKRIKTLIPKAASDHIISCGLLDGDSTLKVATPKASSDNSRPTSSFSVVEEQHDPKAMIPKPSSGTTNHTLLSSSSPVGRTSDQEALTHPDVHQGVSSHSDHSSRPRPREYELGPDTPKSLRKSSNPVRDLDTTISCLRKEQVPFSTMSGAIERLDNDLTESIPVPTAQTTSNTGALFDPGPVSTIPAFKNDTLIESSSHSLNDESTAALSHRLLLSRDGEWCPSSINSSSASPDDDSIAASSYRPSLSSLESTE